MYGEYNNHDIDFLIDHLKHIQKRSHHSFTIIHTRWGDFIGQCRGGNIGVAQRFEYLNKANYHEFGMNNSEYKLEPPFYDRFRNNEYQYTAEDEHNVFALHQDAQEKMKETGIGLRQFLDQLSDRNDIVVPTIIITSDHGEIYEKGRVWYGFHPNEEVIKVPLFIINGQAIGMDDRLFSTQDLTESVLDFFDIKTEEAHSRQSIFSTKAGHDHTATLTLSSQIHKEHYLILVKKEAGKYIVNLHPQSRGEIQRILPSGFDESQVELIDEIPETLKQMINENIEAFKL